MRSTALVSVSVLVSVMASGCAAASDDDFEQQDTGSIEQAATPTVGDYVLVLCSRGDAGIRKQITDLSAVAALALICSLEGWSSKIPVIVSNMKRSYYRTSNNAASASNRPVWYATLKPSNAQYAVAYNDPGMSCFVPFAHRYFMTGFDTKAGCKAAGAMRWYYDYTSTQRTNQCAWIKNQKAFRNLAANNGASVTSDCSNVVGFDPLSSAAICDLEGWVC